MIRASDLATPAVWARPSTTSSRADARDFVSWFDTTPASDARISADLNPAARGLSVEQHANLILAQLCGERAA